jgi:hypothetical protein
VKDLAIQLLRDAATVSADLVDVDRILLGGQLREVERDVYRLTGDLESRSGAMSEYEINDVLRLALMLQNIHNDLEAFWSTNPLPAGELAPREVITHA